MPIPFSRGGGALALLAAVLFASGCATKGDIRDMQEAMRTMSAGQDSVLRQLRLEQTLTQDTLRTQTSRLFEIRGDLATQLQRILDELATLRELTGQNQRTIASVRDQIDALRRTGLVAPTATAEGAGLPGPAQGGGSAEEAYNAAVEQFNRGSLTAARITFERFLQQYPNHRLAADAHFYMADILVQNGNLEEALDAFEIIPQRFPQAAKVPDALYRIGILHLERGDRDEGRRYLERVVNTYPDSTVAQLASERLRGLG
ncbi:MAG: tol-pal system protein YbgF [Gemmatimonadetes bacterium]|nr:tol-pal system protein YbgF [Gemmatimonadota bacterium]